jgi:arylsulfatase A-like enzyme
MSNRRWLLMAGLAACLFSALVHNVNAQQAPRPHVVFFLADDLGWSDVGFHDSEIETPHIDRLAAAGARLEAFYVQPVCSPTRAALMTGRYPMRMGLQVGVIRPWADYGLPLEELLLSQALQGTGYTTAICGKWHLGLHERQYLPTARGFDHQYGHYCGALDYFTHERDGGFDWHRDDQVCRDEGYTTELIGAEAVRLIEQHDPANPLFLYVPFNAPHTPLQALDRHLERYKRITDRKRRIYAAMVHAVDEQIGRIAAAVEKRGLSENTLFIFSSDNGGPINLGATNGPLRAGKGSLYEGGVRVAAFATWPGKIPAGQTIDQPLHIVDWYPTLLALAGADPELPHPLDGKNIWPVLTEGEKSPHEWLLLNAAPTGGAIRAGDWKLVVRGDRSAVDDASSEDPAVARKARESARVELFQLRDDIGETTNLAEKHPEIAARLGAQLAALAAEARPPQSSAGKRADFQVPAVWGESPRER